MTAPGMTDRGPAGGGAADGGAGRAVTVLRTGALTLVTDLGRPGHAHLGVPRSGALDEPALRLANRLVGNPEGAAGLEILLGGVELRAEAGCTVVVTGPPTAVTVTRAGGERRAIGSHRAVWLAAGDRLRVAAPGGGLRDYLGFGGGLEVTPVLGSRSADLLSGLGPPPVQDGDRLPLGPGSPPPTAAEPVPATVPSARLSVPVLLGPRDGWLDRPAEALRATEWSVGPASNRVGLRLSGTPLRRHPDYEDAELPSEPVRPGAVQVPPSGQPVIFLADGPTTGGYPVVGVVDDRWLPDLAQARPGSTLRLRPC